jgi:hypothetical protein
VHPLLVLTWLLLVLTWLLLAETPKLVWML